MMFWSPGFGKVENPTLSEMLLIEMRKEPERGYRSRYLADGLNYTAQEVGQELARMRELGLVVRDGKSWYLSSDRD